VESRFAYIKVFVDAAGSVYLIWRLREHRVISGQPMMGCSLADDDTLRHLSRLVARAERDDPVQVTIIREN
jgi:hypothetical protein